MTTRRGFLAAIAAVVTARWWKPKPLLVPKYRQIGMTNITDKLTALQLHMAGYIDTPKLMEVIESELANNMFRFYTEPRILKIIEESGITEADFE